MDKLSNNKEMFLSNSHNLYTPHDSLLSLFKMISPQYTTRRLPILLGRITRYLVHFILGYCGVGPGIDFTAAKNTKWFVMPPTHAPVFEGSAISLIAPVTVVLTVENMGHVKAVGAMTGHLLDKYMGRTFMSDAIVTMVSAACSSTGVTTYGS
jgi:xanthine/uracil permease